MPGGGGGSTNVDVPPQLGQIGQATTGLAQQEQQFLGEGLSLGNYGISMATGGQGQQITGGGATTYDVAGGTTFNQQQPVMAASSGASPPADTGAPGSGTGNQVFDYGQLTSQEQQQVQQAFGASNGAIISMLNSGQGNPGSPLYETIQRIGNAGRQQQQNPQVSQSGSQAPGLPPAPGSVAWANSPQSQQYASTTQTGGYAGGTLPNGIPLSTSQLTQFMSATPYQQALVAQGLGVSVDQIKSVAKQAQSTGGTGLTTPGENPLYGPWINTAISAIQNEAKGAQTLEGMMGQAAQREGTYYNQGQNLAEQGNKMLEMATTGTGLFPSQQAYVDASVKAGQSQIAQQLASEGLSSSTLGPELSAEIGLQGAATAGQLIQGNISSAVNLQQAAQGWSQLAQGEQTIGFGEQQALTNLFSTIAAQGSSMQNQFWQQGLQGYGLEGAFFNQTLAAYGTSLQAYNSILQGSEVQAQVNASIENANTAANAAIIGDVIKGVSSIVSSIV